MLCLKLFHQSKELNNMGVVKMKLDESIVFPSTVLELFFLCTTITELSFPIAVANQKKNAKMADD